MRHENENKTRRDLLTMGVDETYYKSPRLGKPL